MLTEFSKARNTLNLSILAFYCTVLFLGIVIYGTLLAVLAVLYVIIRNLFEKIRIIKIN